MRKEYQKRNQHASATALTLALLLGMMSNFSVAAEAPKAMTLDYPELVVVPKASDRLTLESKEEMDNPWTIHLPVQLSGVLTLSSGLGSLWSTSSEKIPNYWPGVIATGTGLFWTAGPYFLASRYLPYARAKKKIASMPRATLEDRLTAERISEEEIAAASRLAKILRWSSVVTQTAVNAYVLAQAPKKSMGQVLGGVALVGALVPIFIDHEWETVWDSQQEYKKKIYGPIPGAKIDFKTLDLAPQVSMRLDF